MGAEDEGCPEREVSEIHCSIPLSVTSSASCLKLHFICLHSPTCMFTFLSSRPSHPIVYFESMLAKSREIPVVIPLAETVNQMLQSAKQWTVKAQQMQVGGHVFISEL